MVWHGTAKVGGNWQPSQLCCVASIPSRLLPAYLPAYRLGDRVGVTLPSGPPGGFGSGGAWFEGVCEKVDLRWVGWLPSCKQDKHSKGAHAH